MAILLVTPVFAATSAQSAATSFHNNPTQEFSEHRSLVVAQGQQIAALQATLEAYKKKPDSPIEDWVKITTVFYNCTIVLVSFSVFLTWWKYKREELSQNKNNFLSCTARYIAIQEMIINTDCLTDLNLSIYQSDLSKPFDANLFSKELALSGMMFQLMEDVWLMHELEKNQEHELYAGWFSLFADWMKSEKIVEKWSLLKKHFSENFVEYVNEKYFDSAQNLRSEPSRFKPTHLAKPDKPTAKRR